jgi:hypothetical protein
MTRRPNQRTGAPPPRDNQPANHFRTPCPKVAVAPEPNTGSTPRRVESRRPLNRKPASTRNDTARHPETSTGKITHVRPPLSHATAPCATAAKHTTGQTFPAAQREDGVRFEKAQVRRSPPYPHITPVYFPCQVNRLLSRVRCASGLGLRPTSSDFDQVEGRPRAGTLQGVAASGFEAQVSHGLARPRVARAAGRLADTMRTRDTSEMPMSCNIDRFSTRPCDYRSQDQRKSERLRKIQCTDFCLISAAELGTWRMRPEGKIRVHSDYASSAVLPLNVLNVGPRVIEGDRRVIDPPITLITLAFEYGLSSSWTYISPP